ncbi:MAG TPA: HlyD family efflux transporter periplasmic adaptor subunit, partial [Chloroflexota bacterium]|nr:HlyD family efflux transporter periplasmic adaptor subunit [Chloroflexota bacterium]
VDQAEAQLDVVRAQVKQTTAQQAQAVAQAQTQADRATDALAAARNEQASEAARSQQDLAQAGARVNEARATLKAAQTAQAVDSPKRAELVAQAQAQLDQADSAVRAAQDSQRANAVKTDGQITAGQTQRNLVQAALQGALDKAGANAATTDLNMVRAQQEQRGAGGRAGAAETALRTAEAEAASTVQTAQAAYDQAVGQLAQATATYAQLMAPAADVDLAQAEAQVRSAEAGVTLAQSNLTGAVLAAPIDGTVAQVNASLGQTIGPTAGAAPTPAVVISDMSTLEVRAEVNEGDIGDVRPGAHVDFTVSAYPSATFSGRVRAIQPLGVSENNVITYIAFVDVDRTDQTLLPLMTANTTITTASREDVLTVPNAAVDFAQREGVRRAKRTAPALDAAAPGTAVNVLVLNAGEPVLQPIRVGLSNGTTTEVLAGLSEGQSVITGGEL